MVHKMASCYNLHPIILTFIVLLSACTENKTSTHNQSINNVNQSKSICIAELEGLTFEYITKKHKPMQEEDFYLNKGPISEFRIELYDYFDERERKMPILIKEATWKKSESENCTIWFKKKDTAWIQIGSFIWNKYWGV